VCEPPGIPVLSAAGRARRGLCSRQLCGMTLPDWLRLPTVLK
jgi:hypothetical protein